MGVDICNVRFGCLAGEKSPWSDRSNGANATITTPTPLSIRRSLFGSVDRDEAKAFFEKESARVEEEQKLKYNFDFAKGRPLNGVFKWEKVEKLVACSVCVATPPSETIAVAVAATSASASAASSTMPTTPCKTRSPKKVTKPSRAGKRSPLKNRVLVNRENVDRTKSKQSTITDFLDKSKNLKRPTNK